MASQIRQARQYVPTGGSGSGTTNYETVVLSEFVLAVLLVSATPFARKGKQGSSPYEGQDAIQILALGLVYFLLALLASSGGGRARLAAWLGGLILIVVGLGEAATLVKLFQGSKAQAGASPASPAPAGTTTYADLVAGTGGNPIQFTGGTVQGGHGR